MTVSQATLSAYRTQVNAYSEAAGTFVSEYISALLAQNPSMSVAEVRNEAIEAIKDSLSAFGDQAASIALDFLEDIVASYGISVSTSIVDAIDDSMIDGGVRYAARKLIEGDIAGFTGDVADLSRYYINRSAFENMVANCERNDIRYARVPSGRETCAFCFMLSTRGFVYHTAQTAGEGHSYHKNCDCVIVPGFEGVSWSSQIEGYDPDAMYERWKDCANTVSIDPATTSKSERNAILKEVKTRDFRWLNTGGHSGIEFTDEAVKAKKEQAWKNSSGEKTTAEKLNRLGYRAEFWDDEVTVNGVTKGMADLSTGIEIKTLYGMTSENTFKKHMRSVSKKSGVKFTVIDVSENDGLSESKLRKWIDKYMERYGLKEVRVLWGNDADGLERITLKE